MKLAFAVTAILAVPVMVAAQTNATAASRTNSQAAPTAITAPGFPFPGGFNPPAGLFDQFWNDPACAAKLHLTDAQRKQLQAAALTQRLSLIDGGADALKAFARLSAILEADQLDEAAFKLQLNNLAAATSTLVQLAGEMVVSPRHVLTVEQWQELQKLQQAKRTAAQSALSPRQPATHSPTVGATP